MGARRNGIGAVLAFAVLGSACLDFDKKVSQLCDAGKFDCDAGTAGGATGGGGGGGGGGGTGGGGGGTGGATTAAFTRGICLDKWCFENPFPHALNINAIWGSGPNDVWFACESNVVMHWNGTAWDLNLNAVADPSLRFRNLRGVWGASASDVWLATQDLGPARLMSGTWTTDPSYSGGARSLQAESISGSLDGSVLLGASTSIAARQGMTWSTLSNPVNTAVVSLAGATVGDCWAVLFTDENNPAALVRCDGSERIDAGALPADAGATYAVWARPGEHIFGGNGGVLRRTQTADAGTVLAFERLDLDVRGGTYLPGSTEWVAVGGLGRLSRSSSPASTVVLTGWRDRDLLAVWAATPTDVWVAGQAGAIARGNGTDFVTLQGGTPVSGLRGLVATPRHVLTVGDNGTGLERTADGGWRVNAPPGMVDLRSVIELSNRSLVAAGAGGVFQLTDAGWASLRASGSFDGVAGPSIDDLWAVGGEAWHRTDGGWSVVSTLDGGYFRGVAGNSDGTAVWAVGSQSMAGVAVRLWPDGGQQIEVPGPTTSELFGVAVLEDGGVWACGDTGGLYLRQANGTWSQAVLNGSDTLFDVSVFGADDVWVTGRGIVLRGSSSLTFRELPPGIENVQLEAVRRLGDDVWVVGDRGIILHGRASEL